MAFGIVDAERAENGGEQVDRQEVHRVHQDDPDEHGQRQRGDEGAVAVNDGLRLVFDHLDDHFDEALETARHAGGHAARGSDQDDRGNYSKQHRPQNCVIVDDGKIDRSVLDVRRIVVQVVCDVFTSGDAVLTRWLCCSRHVFSSHLRCLNNKMM